MEAAKKNNPPAGLTGLLYFNRRFFLQCIEGSRSEINLTYNKILKGKRHKDITLLSYQDIIERQFSSWQMGYLPESDLTQSTYIHFSNKAEFNPYFMSGESAKGLILELKEILKNNKSSNTQ